MHGIERLLIEFLLNFATAEQINIFFGDPRNTALLIGALVAFATALCGVFLVLRKMAMTADAISHTVLFGIVAAFLAMLWLGQEPSLSSPLLLLGAAAAGVGTVLLTELIQRSNLVKGDTALGLAFPFLFALAVILVTRYIPNVHLDADSVMVGEIGVAWANTNSHCLANCEPVTITADDPRATVARTCVNCAAEGISPRSPRAAFEETCGNCGTFSAAEAWQRRLISAPPQLVFVPRALLPLGSVSLLNLLFVLFFYKELKLATFDAGLAAAFGFKPALLSYALMILVSLTAVAAFDAVGSILVVAFFIIPAAAAYLLTDRLWLMFVIAPLLGIFAAFTGYEVARTWDISISAAMVIMLFACFSLIWVLSPRYGLLAGLVRRWRQHRQFAEQLLLGHLYNHQRTAEADAECARETLHQHLNWSPRKTAHYLARLQAGRLVQLEAAQVRLTLRGEAVVQAFRTELLAH
ncbi:MAG: metal ABC transporter permease [Chloroflexi bacterium CFX4]|nr:metal ABC transporter permease [Chloroflexi bacterium CFX4]MDL1923584.1 metal ABC transporter permease [Chloroflexi bacterium CFX3]